MTIRSASLCAKNNCLETLIVEQLQLFFHQHNELATLFKTALDRMPTDNHKIVIRADKMPTGKHAIRLNAPTIDEVAIVVVSENFENWDIVSHRGTRNCSRCPKHIDPMMRYNILSYSDKVKMIMIFFHSLYMKDTPLLFTWPYIWKMGQEFILQKKKY